MNKKEFDNFLKTCYLELQNKQKKITGNLEKENFDEYKIDTRQKKIHFIKNDEIKLSYEFVFIGSWSEEDDSWLWAWANDSIDKELQKDSEQLKGLYEKTGYDEFKESEISCDDSMAYELVAFSVHYLKARGMYALPGEFNEFYIALL